MKAKVLHNLRHNGVSYEPGDTFEGDNELVGSLISDGILADPNAVAEKADDSIVVDAQAKAQKIIKDAQDEADKIKSDAESEAQKILKAARDEANTEHVKIGDDDYAKTTYESGAVRYTKNGQTSRKDEFEAAQAQVAQDSNTETPQA